MGSDGAGNDLPTFSDTRNCCFEHYISGMQRRPSLYTVYWFFRILRDVAVQTLKCGDYKCAYRNFFCSQNTRKVVTWWRRSTVNEPLTCVKQRRIWRNAMCEWKHIIVVLGLSYALGVGDIGRSVKRALAKKSSTYEGYVFANSWDSYVLYGH